MVGKIYVNYDKLFSMVYLTELEHEQLKLSTPKAKEIYLMKKFIHIYKQNNCGTQTTCYRWLNDFREIHGYNKWKEGGSVRRLWYVEFQDLNKELVNL
ncbi:hypothetical protein [Alkalihalobacillus sp. R86527]|uniref:hypothetical protein n=1 Tax=Alkalihalobacillus sp. R86527 TaxID=3093863 RepID=UPI0036725F3C